VTLEEIQKNMIGDWSGSNLLRTSWLTPPESVSSSRLRVEPVARGKFLKFTYTCRLHLEDFYLKCSLRFK
jgi:hypothetical protein